MHIFKDTNYNFLRWRWYALGLSWAIVLAGVFVMMTKGIPLGVEFAGGTVVVTQFEQPVSIEQVRGAMQQAFPGVETSVQEYGTPGEHKIMVRVPLVGSESDGSLSRSREQITSALKQSSLGNFSIAGSEIVGPIVGEELTRKGIWATVLSMVAILLYIGLRFQISFGVGAIVATIHDLLVTLAFLAFFQYDLTLNVIAAILTITGYSTNDTIVIFDRVRENSRCHASGRPERDHQPVDQPDPRTDAHYSRHGADERAGAVPVRRRSAAWLRVHDGRRHHHGHLLDHFHRRGDRELLARKRAHRRRLRRRLPRFLSPRASPSSGKHARRRSLQSA